MKLLTLNFLTCATKDCRAASGATHTDADTASPFPLLVREAELARLELDFQPLFWRNVIPRIEWPAMRAVVTSLGLTLPDAVVDRYLTEQPDADVNMSDAQPALVKVGGAGVDEPSEEPELDEETLKKLHQLLLETQVQEGALVCGRCGHHYAVKEGIANFLLPPHLV